jgi:hypothetical protein
MPVIIYMTRLLDLDMNSNLSKLVGYFPSLAASTNSFMVMVLDKFITVYNLAKSKYDVVRAQDGVRRTYSIQHRLVF